MRPHIWHLGCFLAIWGMAWGSQNSPVYAQGRDSGLDILTRGPIHEAFAQPVNTGKVETLIVTQRPPQDIEETPPDTRPADDAAIWIPGYWAWDDDNSSYLWVSGVWRVPPPGQQWVSGYWTQVVRGYQWVPGFWTSNPEDVAYYPEPPASLERGPTSDPPSADVFWVSGCWRWQDTRYVWQPGYWAPAYNGWVWQPASYYSSPRGWIFNTGYWDYPLTERGLIFAPVRFASRDYLNPNFVYSPSVVIDTGPLSFYLFTRPAYGHYYFGDYYAGSYDRLGIYPWFAVNADRRYTYDPLFSYYRWYYHTRDPKWADHLRGWHSYYREHADQRPPHNFAAEQQLLARGAARADQPFLRIADTLDSFRNRENAPVRLTAVPPDERSRIRTTSRDLSSFRNERAKAEMRLTDGTATAPESALQRAATAMPKSPEKAPLPKLPATIARRTTVDETRTADVQRQRRNVPGTPRPGTSATAASPQPPGRQDARTVPIAPRTDVGERDQREAARTGRNFLPEPPNVPGRMPNRNLTEQTPGRELPGRQPEGVREARRPISPPETGRQEVDRKPNLRQTPDRESPARQPQGIREAPRPVPPSRGNQAVNRTPEIRQTPNREPPARQPETIREARRPNQPQQPPPRMENRQRPPPESASKPERSPPGKPPAEKSSRDKDR